MFFCITNKEDPMPLLVWVGYWPSVPEYAPGQRSAVEYSISMYQRRPAAAHQPVPATSLHSPAVVCGDQWSEAHTIHSPAPRCAPDIPTAAVLHNVLCGDAISLHQFVTFRLVSDIVLVQSGSGCSVYYTSETHRLTCVRWPVASDQPVTSYLLRCQQ